MLTTARCCHAGNADQQAIQALQYELDQQRQSYESLSEQLDEAHEQALYASNDARMWEEAYTQTVNADLERENGELLFDNKQLHEDVAQATRRGEYRLLVPIVSLCMPSCKRHVFEKHRQKILKLYRHF